MTSLTERDVEDRQSARAIGEEAVQWVDRQLADGVPIHVILDAMRSKGWAERDIRHVLGLPQGGSGDFHDVPEPNIEGGRSVVRAGGRDIRVLMTKEKPRIVVFDDILTPDECEFLIEASRSRLERSVIYSPDGNVVDDIRTSEGMWFEYAENDMIRSIEERVCELVGWSTKHTQKLQVLHYPQDSEYQPHHDYFGRYAVEEHQIAQRVGTLIMYLNEPARGGGTQFVDAGLQVMPRRGMGVFFSYDRPDPATLTFHGGMPVHEGEKWIATKWFTKRGQPSH